MFANGHVPSIPRPFGSSENPRLKGATTLTLVWAAITVCWLGVAGLFWTTTAALTRDDHNGTGVGADAIHFLLIELAVAGTTGAVVVLLAIAARRAHEPARLILAVVLSGLAIGHVLTLLITGVVLFLSSILGFIVLVLSHSGERVFPWFCYGILSVALEGALIVLAIVCSVQLFRARPVPVEGTTAIPSAG